MEAYFHHKIKKGKCDFYFTIQTFFIAILRERKKKKRELQNINSDCILTIPGLCLAILIPWWRYILSLYIFEDIYCLLYLWNKSRGLAKRPECANEKWRLKLHYNKTQNGKHQATDIQNYFPVLQYTDRDSYSLTFRGNL